uniref:Integrase zinc-binding domain-containing protein n=1 Tax=Trichogramma kaykai TaxID=54128 RepID=A0ABD2W1U4_9HYME
MTDNEVREISNAYTKRLPQVAVEKLPKTIDKRDPLVVDHRVDLKNLSSKSVATLVRQVRGCYVPWISVYMFSTTYLIVKTLIEWDGRRKRRTLGVDVVAHLQSALDKVKTGKPLSLNELNCIVHILIMDKEEMGHLPENTKLAGYRYPRRLTKTELLKLRSQCKGPKVRAEFMALASYPTFYGMYDERDISASCFHFVSRIYTSPWARPVIAPYRAQVLRGPAVSVDRGLMAAEFVKDRAKVSVQLRRIVPGGKNLYKVRPTKSRAKPFETSIPILDEEDPNVLFPDEIEIDEVPQSQDPHCDDATDTEDVVIGPGKDKATEESDDESDVEGDEVNEEDDVGDENVPELNPSHEATEPSKATVQKPILTLKSVMDKFGIKESTKSSGQSSTIANSSKLHRDVLANNAGDYRKRQRTGSNSDQEAPPDASRVSAPLPSTSTPLTLPSGLDDGDDYPSPCYSPIQHGGTLPHGMQARKRMKTDSPAYTSSPAADAPVVMEQIDNVAETDDNRSGSISPRVLLEESVRQYSAERNITTLAKSTTSSQRQSLTDSAARPTRRKLFILHNQEDSELVAASAFNVRARIGQTYEEANCIRPADNGVDPFAFSISSPPRVGVTPGYVRTIQPVQLRPFNEVPNGGLIKVKLKDACYWTAVLVGPPNARRGIYSVAYRVRYLVATSNGTAAVGKDTVPMSKEFMRNWIPTEIEKDCKDKWPINIHEVLPLTLQDSGAKENCHPTIVAMKKSQLINENYEPVSHEKFLEWVRSCPTCPAALKPSPSAKVAKGELYIVSNR